MAFEFCTRARRAACISLAPTQIPRISKSQYAGFPELWKKFLGWACPRGLNAYEMRKFIARRPTPSLIVRSETIRECIRDMPTGGNAMKWRFRYSLKSLLWFALFAGSILGLWFDRHAWVLSNNKISGYCLCFSPDGKRVLSIQGGRARIWDAESGRTSIVLQGDNFTGAVLSPDGTRVAGITAEWAGIWDARSGELLTILKKWGDPVYRGKVFVNDPSRFAGPKFSPDGEKVLVGTNEKICVWNTGDGRLHATLNGHTGDCCDVSFSHDGKTILSTSFDDTARARPACRARRRGSDQSVQAAP